MFAQNDGMKIEEEIKQPNFKDEFEKADINIMYTANWMNSKFYCVIKPFDISTQQFNILRILRGQNGKPVSLKLLTERMMDKMSNTSRLVEKMLSKDLLKRKVCPENRRQIEINLTEEGLNVCNELSKEIEIFRNNDLKITEKEAVELNRILDKIRS